MSEIDTLADLVDVTERLIPFNRILGIHNCRIDDGVARIRVDHREDLVGNFARGFLHGGVVAATLDVAGGIAAMMAVVGRTPPKTRQEAGQIFSNISTIDMRIDYLRPGVGAWFDASAAVLRSGSRVVVTRMEFHNDEGTLVAVGTGTYIVG
jgi:uncharacterized protein (TIGR00369 family)